VHHANANAEMLLWNSSYGSSVRGGSTSERVKAFAAQRGLDVWVIKGSETLPWIEWALSTSRYVALSFDNYHFQTAIGMETDKKTFYVVDNNSPTKIQKVPREQFIARHRDGGSTWCVIIKGPSPPPWVAPESKNWVTKKLPRENNNAKIQNTGVGFDRSSF